MDSVNRAAVDDGAAEMRQTRAHATLGVRIWNAANVRTSGPAPAAVHTVLSWIRGHIIRPHPDLGRPGPMCPFVLPSLQLRCTWISVVEGEITGDDEIYATLAPFVELYHHYEPAVGAGSGLRTFIIVFPQLEGDDVGTRIDRVHSLMKPTVVGRGLMLGEFYPQSMSPGVHNPQFYSLRSPLPLFVLRHMVPGDFVFLTRPSDPPERRVHFLRSYLRAMEASLSPERLAEARRALATTELEAQRAECHSGT